MKNRKKILDELKHAGVSWSDTDPSQMPYSIPDSSPENYFQELPAQILSSIQALKNVEDLIAQDPSSEESNKNLPHIRQKEKSPSFLLKLPSFRKRMILAASVTVMLFLALILVWLQKNNNGADTVQLNVPSSIPDTEIIRFLENTNSAYTLDLTNDLSFHTMPGSETNTIIFADISDEELNTYMKLNGSTINESIN